MHRSPQAISRGGAPTRALSINCDKAPAANAVALAEVIDSLSAGVFVVGTDGVIVHANVQARAILASNDMLRAVSGRLMAIDPRINPVLRGALIAATLEDTGSALSLTSRDGMRHLVQVLPLRASGRRAAAVFVARATFETSSCGDVIRCAYHLTPAELRVLFAIVDFGGVPEVAAALGIANSTVRTHVGHLFRKTGASRQADLVKLVAAFSQRLVA